MENGDDFGISVIIATKNSGRTLGSCLASLSRNIGDLEGVPVETLFVDFDSVDDTLELAASFPNGKIIHAKKRGIAHAHNLGVSFASGRFICFLNSDDELGEGFLRRLYEICFESGTDDNVIVYTTVQFIGAHGDYLYKRFPPRYFEWIHRRCSVILHPNAMYPSSLMKRHFFEETQDFRPTDREQVMNVMREARSYRVRDVYYKFRIWGNSETVQRSKGAHTEVLSLSRLAKLLARCYIHLYEDNKLRRILMRLRGRTFWRSV